MGQQEYFVLSAFCASGLVFERYKCVQRLSCLLLKFIDSQAQRGLKAGLAQITGSCCLLILLSNSKWWGAGLELLKAVLVASRMETRSQTFNPSSLFVGFFFTMIPSGSIHSDPEPPSSSLFAWVPYLSTGERVKPTFGVLSRSSSHQLLCSITLPYTSLTSWKVN